MGYTERMNVLKNHMPINYSSYRQIHIKNKIRKLIMLLNLMMYAQLAETIFSIATAMKSCKAVSSFNPPFYYLLM